VTIKSADITKVRYSRGVNVRYTVLGKEMTVTPTVSGTNPVFNHSAIFKFDKVPHGSFAQSIQHLKLLTGSQVGQELLDWFETGCLSLLVYAAQEDPKPSACRPTLTTKQLMPSAEEKRNAARATSAKYE
jgi:hypothetical protein